MIRYTFTADEFRLYKGLTSVANHLEELAKVVDKVPSTLDDDIYELNSLRCELEDKAMWEDRDDTDRNPGNR